MADKQAFNSIVVARNLGLEKKDRKATNIGVEKFLLQTLSLHGLNPSDLINIALEKYLRDTKYLTEETLQLLDNITLLEEQIFKNK